MEKRIEAELPNQKFTVDDAKRMLEKLSETFGNKSVGDMWSMGFLTTMHVTDILDLLNTQKAEIEKLRNIVKTDLINAKSDFKLSLSDIAEIRAEVINEYNAMLYAYKTNIFIKGEELIIIPRSDYEEIIKEMVGDSDA